MAAPPCRDIEQRPRARERDGSMRGVEDDRLRNVSAAPGASSATGHDGESVVGPRFLSLIEASEGPLVCPQGCAPTSSGLSPRGRHDALSRRAATASWEDHEFRNPRRTASDRRKRRWFVYALLDGLRPFSAKRVRACGWKRIAHEVEVVRVK